MSDFLFGLPTWIIVAGVCFSCICAFACWVLCSAADLGDMYGQRADRADQRMRDLNHRDVQDRADTREFQSWNADDDLPA